MKTLTNIFIGRSGCGKGTQIKQLTQSVESQDWKRVFHLEAGDRFRKFIEEESYSTKLAREISDDGGLQPEFLSIWAWGGELAKGFKEDQHLFIDGTPRRLIEAKILESVFDFYNIEKQIRNNMLESFKKEINRIFLLYFFEDISGVVQKILEMLNNEEYKINPASFIDKLSVIKKDLVKKIEK